eukprot:1159903-Pelagomonas_calceolata.AAC.9
MKSAVSQQLSASVQTRLLHGLVMGRLDAVLAASLSQPDTGRKEKKGKCLRWATASMHCAGTNRKSTN